MRARHCNRLTRFLTLFLILSCFAEMTRPSFLTQKKPTLQQTTRGAPSSSKFVQEKAATSALNRTVPNALKIKKRDSPSLNQVARLFADIGDTNITEEELSQWRGKTEEDKDSFILKGTSELLVHLHDREERRLEDAASTKKTEETLSKLKEDYKSQRAELKKALDG